MAPADFTANLQPHPSANGAAILAQERQRSSISPTTLSTHLFGLEYLSRQQRILDILLKDKVFSKTNQANLSRPDRYKLGLARGKRMRQLMDIHNWDMDDLLMAEYLIDEPQPYHLHMSLFAAAMRDQTTAEQSAYWQPKIDSWEIVGAYAQTELGHGSNVRGIECEARWDQGRREFVLHSPTLTASKWWNGTLGRTATHAVVVAQLMLPRDEGGWVSQGPHPFIVRIRDKKTHRPLEGIVVGDIGPKYGYAPMDNAYCLFSHHRIPHSALLSRYASVDPETGEYTKPKNPASVYGSLTRGRAFIVLNARLMLFRATTVAVRYLSIRRQFRDRDASDQSGPEMAVLDYTTVQIRVLPLLATAYALHYTGQAMWDLYNRTRSSQALDGDRAQLAELHSTSAGLKSLATDLAANGIETCRRAMGGHGYGGGTGLVQLNADYLAKPTVEGDNWMITQQAARYLISRCEGVVSNSKSNPDSATETSLLHFHTHQSSPPNLTSVDNDEDIAAAFAWRTSFYAFRAHRHRNIERKSWNSLLIDLYKLSTAYSQSLLVSNFLSALKSSATQDLPTETRDVMRDLYRLFALYTIETYAREFQTSSALSPALLESIPSQVLELMAKIRPHAVKLVDSFSLPDYLLDSALGREDGKVYEDLFQKAHVLNPLNRETFNPDYRNDEIVMGSGDGGKILSKL